MVVSGVNADERPVEIDIVLVQQEGGPGSLLEAGQSEPGLEAEIGAGPLERFFFLRGFDRRFDDDEIGGEGGG